MEMSALNAIIINFNTKTIFACMWYVVFYPFQKPIPILFFEHSTTTTMMTMQETKADALFPNRFQFNSLDFAVLLSLILQLILIAKTQTCNQNLWLVLVSRLPITKYQVCLRSLRILITFTACKFLSTHSLTYGTPLSPFVFLATIKSRIYAKYSFKLQKNVKKIIWFPMNFTMLQSCCAEI